MPKFHRGDLIFDKDQECGLFIIDIEKMVSGSDNYYYYILFTIDKDDGILNVYMYPINVIDDDDNFYKIEEDLSFANIVCQRECEFKKLIASELK